jgi:hypothetical protein
VHHVGHLPRIIKVHLVDTLQALLAGHLPRRVNEVKLAGL